MNDGQRTYRLIARDDDGKRTVLASAATIEAACQTMNEFTAHYPLFSRLTIECEATGEPTAEWFRPVKLS
jgi:hypothetical protein